MKTKMSYREFRNITIVKEQLGKQLHLVRREWLNDLKDNGQVKLHSKTYKTLKQIFNAINALRNITELMEHEID